MKLNLFAPLNTTSYGYHSSYTYHYLSKMGWDVRHLPIGQNNPDEKFSFGKEKFHYDAPCLKIWHQFDLSGFTGSPKIGFTVFELEDLNENEVWNMKYPDKLIVASKWAQKVCENHGINASVVPLGYDHEIFYPTPQEEKDHTIFGNFGKWEIRKGHDVLIRAFNAAFEKDDNVTLVMMPSNPFLSETQRSAWEKMYLNSKLGSKVQIVPRLPNHKDVAHVMNQIHCGVFPARAEGWNLEPLELLACGKHLIISDCTGHKEYANSNNSMMIDMPDKFESAYDGVFFNGASKWRSLGKDQFDQLVNYMREFHKNRSYIINSNGVKDSKEFTWENSIDKLSKKIV
jgi:glycosyltransferase involved in cell wall biosynthesis